MARHRRLASFAALLATASVLLAPAPGVAEDLATPDARNDYWHDHRSDGFPPDQHRPDWGHPDIRRTLYRHTQDEVVVRITMARLVRRDGGYWRIDARFRTDEGLRRTVELFKPHDGPAIVDWSGRRDCAIGTHIDYADDVFVLRVPRRCLSLPSEVELKSSTRWWPTSDDVAYLDVSGSPGYRLNQWSPPLGRG